MGLWHVFSADWQTECCGTPFPVGDEVSRPQRPRPGRRTERARPPAPAGRARRCRWP
ncbi:MULTISPECIES: DUF6578 domain-containing protein [Streptomyces]|uniref:DUF6578 domain-containing protein n=1 Tax=Streptomyces TaxID=1883 RepID=UPI0030845BAD